MAVFVGRAIKLSVSKLHQLREETLQFRPIYIRQIFSVVDDVLLADHLGHGLQIELLWVEGAGELGLVLIVVVVLLAALLIVPVLSAALLIAAPLPLRVATLIVLLVAFLLVVGLLLSIIGLVVPLLAPAAVLALLVPLLAVSALLLRLGPLVGLGAFRLFAGTAAMGLRSLRAVAAIGKVVRGLQVGPGFVLPLLLGVLLLFAWHSLVY